MELYLSRNSPVNCVLSDPEGRPLYQVYTPGFAPGLIRWTRKTTTIFRISPEASETYKDEIAKGNDVEDSWDLGLKEKSRIHWHTFSSTRIVYHGKILEVKDFMPREGVLGLPVIQTESERLLDPMVNPTVGEKGCVVVGDEGTSQAKVIARMHQRNILEGTKPYLEIDPEGIHILELIITTWVYYESRRRDEEREHM